MYETRQPITNENYAAFRAAQSARLIEERPYSPVIARDIKEEMTQRFIDDPQLTQDELLSHYDADQVARYSAAAFREASRRATRRIA